MQETLFGNGVTMSPSFTRTSRDGILGVSSYQGATTFPASSSEKGIAEHGDDEKNMANITQLDQKKEQKILRMRSNIKTVSLFSGGGGLDLGFAAAGYDVVYANDIDEYSCRSLVANQEKKEYYRTHQVVAEDISALTGKDIFKAAGLKLGDIDMVIGGPPCQSFSIFGKRKGMKDPRGNMIWEYCRIIKELEPKAFLFENVFGLKSIHGGTLIESLKEGLSINGTYDVDIQTYQLANYGIPQFRERVVIIGNMVAKKIPLLEVSHGPTAPLPYRTVQEVLKNMPTPNQNSGLQNHTGREHSTRIIKRYANLRHGERDPKTRINKLNPSKPSYTIIVGSDHGGGKGHVHPYQPREVTPRESARLQSFPDWWHFDGKGRHVIRQVGNAVPPLFAIQMAAHIKKHIFGAKETLSYSDSIKRLGLTFLQ